MFRSRRRLLALFHVCLALALATTLACVSPKDDAGGPAVDVPIDPTGVPAPPDFSVALAVLEDAIAKRVFPGCAVAVGGSAGPLWSAAVGKLDYASGDAVTTTTVYDLASLTKVIGTTSVLMALVLEGALDLGAPLGDVLARHGLERTVPAGEDPLRDVPLHALLSHTSGLPAWLPFYKTASSYDELLAAVLATPPGHPSGEYHYSDLGFILLGAIAERAGGAPLGELEERLVFAPLGMTSTTRVLAPPFDRIAPTEEIESDDGQRVVVRGVVHDENARAAGGVTGHAGLFSDVLDLTTFAGEVLRAARGEASTIDPAVLRRFLDGSPEGRRYGRAFGWELARPGRSCGRFLSRSAFGHTGFTGTSLWIDPERDLYIVLLSNRVHPSRANPSIGPVRRRFADAVVLAVTAARERARGAQ